MITRDRDRDLLYSRGLWDQILTVIKLGSLTVIKLLSLRSNSLQGLQKVCLRLKWIFRDFAAEDVNRYVCTIVYMVLYNRVKMMIYFRKPVLFQLFNKKNQALRLSIDLCTVSLQFLLRLCREVAMTPLLQLDEEKHAIVWSLRLLLRECLNHQSVSLCYFLAFEYSLSVCMCICLCLHVAAFLHRERDKWRQTRRDRDRDRERERERETTRREL